MAEGADHMHKDGNPCYRIVIDGKPQLTKFDDLLGGVIGPCPDAAEIETKEILKLSKQVTSLRHVNTAMVNEYESMGGSLDLTMARMEHLMGHLVSIGVITELQHMQEALAWEEHLKPQVKAARDSKRAEVQAAQKAVEQGKAAQEARQKLILPPGARGR